MMAALVHSWCVQTYLCLQLSVSGVFLSSDGKVFHTDVTAAEKICGPKLTVLILDAAKSPTSANRECR